MITFIKEITYTICLLVFVFGTVHGLHEIALSARLIARAINRVADGSVSHSEWKDP